MQDLLSCCSQCGCVDDVKVSVDLLEGSELMAEMASVTIHADLLAVELATILGLELVMSRIVALKWLKPELPDVVSELAVFVRAVAIRQEVYTDVSLIRRFTKKLTWHKTCRWGLSGGRKRHEITELRVSRRSEGLEVLCGGGGTESGGV